MNTPVPQSLPQPRPYGAGWLLLRSALRVLYPASCVVCQAELLPQEAAICTGCLLAMPPTDYHQYPATNALYHEAARLAPIAGAGACWYFRPGEPVQAALHALKYGGHRAAGQQMGAHYGQLLRGSALLAGCQAVVPVPIHPRKVRERGYNQAEVIARALCRQAGVPCRAGLATRRVYTTSQTGMTRPERIANTAGIFRIQGRVPASVAVLDDVITSGATAASLANALLDAGAQRVVLLALAAPQDG